MNLCNAGRSIQQSQKKPPQSILTPDFLKLLIFGLSANGIGVLEGMLVANMAYNPVFALVDLVACIAAIRLAFFVLNNAVSGGRVLL
jgi:hypothetical protein